MSCLFGFQAVAKLGWLEPTPIQEKAIPILLEGKDVLLRARTGSGKTGAFAIPVIQRILNSKQVSKPVPASQKDQFVNEAILLVVQVLIITV